jgi:uncharacterized protein YprB with RNaseH-like and TPR domain
MIADLRPEQILFLDIETVSQHQTCDELTLEAQELWAQKIKFLSEKTERTPAELYRQAGIYAEFGKVICISVGYYRARSNEHHLVIRSFFGHDEHELLSGFAFWMNAHFRKPFDVLCAHNGKEFDFPYLCRRFIARGIAIPKMLQIQGKKPWEVPHLDTMELWKFGDYKHYTSVKLLAYVLGIESPKDDITGADIHHVYYHQRDLIRIERYCRKDVVTVARILFRFQEREWFQDLIPIAA